jgi:hypothetical protein
MQLGFGSGVLVGTPSIDITGAPVTNPTPTEFGLLQDCSVDFDFDLKELFGTYQFPVAIGRGKGKITGKAKFAQINGLMLNNLVFGASYASIVLGQVKDYTGATIPTTPFTITPTVPGTGIWIADMGVTDSNRRPMQRVASAPTTGQYTVTAGVYVFSTADTGKLVFINYQYTNTSTVGKKITIPNSLMGAAPQFRVDLFIPYQGASFVLTLGAAVAKKLSFATKLDDFTIPEFDFTGFSDASNNIAYLSLAE